MEKRRSQGSRAMRDPVDGGRLGLAERLVAARKRRRLRQLDAAREIGVCRQTIALIEVDYIAGEKTRAKVSEWLAAQEAAGGAESAAGDGPGGMGGGAGGAGDDGAGGAEPGDLTPRRRGGRF